MKISTMLIGFTILLGLAACETKDSQTVEKPKSALGPGPEAADAVQNPAKDEIVDKDFADEAEQQIDGKNYQSELDQLAAELDSTEE